ncbi:hypothetical protein PAXRUDRAFT_28020 [Paxillus rubicundulus Ve08.2h10]|uniref:Uncharacterized protein n=1 Tax=Paxillus rubicundulus Ve08.2h10 TaxID=930991 RepID=A0A0D0CE77_9AGAM|nr:hypothetical protein PAXRUDRAFT_28020 [Paxillus rubicundulus Ve08.2h10]
MPRLSDQASDVQGKEGHEDHYQALLKSLDGTMGGHKWKILAIVAWAYKTQLYNDWVKAIPGFSGLITKFKTDPDALSDLIDMMGTAANGGRMDDTRNLKFDGLDYMLKDPTKDKVWKQEEETHCHEIPSLLYNMTIFDPENKHDGFLHGHTLVQTLHHIFTGPVSAFNKTPCAAKPSKGRIHDLQEPNICNIMYAAVQIYYTMNTKELCTSMIGMVDLADMFYVVVDLVEQKSDEQWVKDLMEFWKNEAPGLILGGPYKHCKTAVNPGNSDSEDNLAGFEDDPLILDVCQHRAIARPPTRSGPAHDNNNNDCDGNDLCNGDASANNNM